MFFVITVEKVQGEYRNQVVENHPYMHGLWYRDGG
jgi:hypothetical protein